ncbi:hypothetical protein [Acidovorax sp.]|jgi:hypothetical protein|uniref:hypothetical protein n=1 Tax=Acidovorax sp. TaxID=1872122 RepID=UPI0025C30713|nr:hypothetical protein [Acidovorax sp.]
MIKVLERMVIWLGTPLLAFLAGPWAILVLLGGAFLIYLTWPTAVEVNASSTTSSTTPPEKLQASESGRPPKSKRPVSRASDDDEAQPRNSEEEFLARERYEEWCKHH